MRTTRALGAILLSIGCVGPRGGTSTSSFRPSFDIQTIVSNELLSEANHDRVVLGADGRFVVAQGVKRVWIDVGAADLDTVPPDWRKSGDMLVIAVEPLTEYWSAWPDHERLIALPVALSTERGWLDFHVNRFAVTSSLLKSVEKSGYDDLTKTVQVRKVPVLRLEDVLERIPPTVEVEYLKTDVQGHDLQVLKSGGEQLRRVKRIKAEVINTAMYEGQGDARPGTEVEFVAYLKRMGFRFEADSDVQSGRRWLDKSFVNEARH